MRNTLYYALFAGTVAIMLFTSCSLLDTEPEDFVQPGEFYKTEKQLQSALLGVYATLANNSVYGVNMLGRVGLTADLGYERYSIDESSVGYYNVSSADAKILGYWRDLYSGIGRANMLLKYIGQPQMDETIRTKIEAQTRFLRAYYHFMLVIRFMNIPLITEVPEDSNKTSVQIPQSDPREVYRWIIREMEWAAPLLPNASTLTGGGELSKSAAYGLLARVALYMAGNPLNEPGMYAKAKEYAATVIGYEFHELNPSYKDVFLKLIQDEYDIRESIFEVEFYGNNQSTYTTTAGQVGRINGIAYSIDINNWGRSLGTIRASQYFYQLFDKDDLRRDWTIASYSYDGKTGEKIDCANNYWMRFCGKFRREYELSNPKDSQYTPINFPVLRYADVLLMYAEAVAADPDNDDSQELADAYEYLNRIRRRGHGLDIHTPAPAVDLEQAGKSALLDEIKDERARELGFELLRKDDLVRWGELYDRMQAIRSTIPAHYTSSYYVAARLYYGNVSRRDIVWPIPSYELGVNRRLVQNEGF